MIKFDLRCKHSNGGTYDVTVYATSKTEAMSILSRCGYLDNE